MKEDRIITKRRRHMPDQIIRKLAEGNKLLAGGMKASDAKRLQELEVENTRLKKLLAEAKLELELDKSMPREIAEGNL